MGDRMSVQWLPTEDVLIDVDDPGHGYLTAELADSGDGPGSGLRVVEGRELGEMLRSLTELALSCDVDAVAQVAGLWVMTAVQARSVLPAMQSAVVLAAAGTERYERLLERLDPVQALAPICAHCEEFHSFADRNPSPSPWCAEHGHDPFGEQPPRSGNGWVAAQQRHAEHAAAVDQLGRLPRRGR